MFAKVCGLKNEEQLNWAIKLGYDAFGIVLYKKSKRYLKEAEAIKLAQLAKGKIISFAVSVNYEDVKNVADVFDHIQINEEIEHPKLISSYKSEPVNLKSEYFLYDISHGTGDFKSFPAWIQKYQNKIILAGGLTPSNVAEIIKKHRPFGVDVSSGVEINGKKDFLLMQEFINEVRANEQI